jgi:hypothetical protein
MVAPNLLHVEPYVVARFDVGGVIVYAVNELLMPKLLNPDRDIDAIVI